MKSSVCNLLLKASRAPRTDVLFQKYYAWNKIKYSACKYFVLYRYERAGPYFVIFVAKIKIDFIKLLNALNIDH